MTDSVPLRLTHVGPGSRAAIVEYVREVIEQRTVNKDTTADRLARGIVTQPRLVPLIDKRYWNPVSTPSQSTSWDAGSVKSQQELLAGDSLFAAKANMLNVLGSLLIHA